MLLGTMLLGGIGQRTALFPAALMVSEGQTRMEERLMLATFPDE